MTLFEQILTARGLTTRAAREAFLQPDYVAVKHDPFLLPDMERAVARLKQAREQGEKIVIYGDYDIDGLSATALLLDAFWLMKPVAAIQWGGAVLTLLAIYLGSVKRGR